jgi:hypothetical protein
MGGCFRNQRICVSVRPSQFGGLFHIRQNPIRRLLELSGHHCKADAPYGMSVCNRAVFWHLYKRSQSRRRRSHINGEKMSSTVYQIVSVVAGLALLTTYYVIYWIFPIGGKMRHLAQGLAVTVTLAMIAAFLLAAARTFGP